MQKIQQMAAIATAIGALGLTACNDRQASQVAAPVVAPVPEPPPPPSVGTQHERALANLGATITGEGLKVTLASADFAPGSAQFKPESSERIDHVAALLKEREALKVQIIGFTDDRGSDAANQRLSQQRAEAVARVLLSQAGIPEERVEAMGKGEADPVASNDSEEGRAQNRRVVLLVVDQSGGYRSFESGEADTG